MRPITHIVIHTAGAQSNGRAVDQSADIIRDYHKRVKGWSDIGYHYVIRFNGEIERGRPVDQPGAGVAGFNARSIHICCTGHGDVQGFTSDQMKNLVGLIKVLMERHNLMVEFRANPMRVLGHRECYLLPGVPNTGKTCPGSLVSMRDIRLRVLAVVQKPINDHGQETDDEE